MSPTQENEPFRLESPARAGRLLLRNHTHGFRMVSPAADGWEA